MMRWERALKVGVTGLIVGAAISGWAGTAGAQDVPEWVRQFGTAAGDFAYGVSTDAAGNLYLAGVTTGSLGGPNRGSFDAWVAKHDAAGLSLWTRQLGTADIDFAYGVVSDGVGSVYAAGWTYGSIGGVNKGGADAWLVKYDASGTVLWRRNIGSAGGDFATGVSADAAGTVYVTGSTTGSLGGSNKGGADAWLARYDPAGHVVWKRQLGTAADEAAQAVTTDAAGNALVVGYSFGPLGGRNRGNEDAWLAKYDATGRRVWITRFGGETSDLAYAVATDAAGNVFMTGYTFGSPGGPNQGNEDVWLVKYDSAGRLAWKRQFGTAWSDYALGVTTDAAGNALLTGVTSGALGGPHQGDQDAWVAKYDPAGVELWRRQLGTSALDGAYSIATDLTGNFYLGGSTNGALDGLSQGDTDAWVAKYPQEP